MTILLVEHKIYGKASLVAKLLAITDLFQFPLWYFGLDTISWLVDVVVVIYLEKIMSKQRLLLILSIFFCGLLLLTHSPILHESTNSVRFVNSLHLQLHNRKLDSDGGVGKTSESLFKTSKAAKVVQKPLVPITVTDSKTTEQHHVDSTMNLNPKDSIHGKSTIDLKKTDHKKEIKIKSTNDVPKFIKNVETTQSAVPLCSSRGDNLVGRLYVDQSIPKDMTTIEKTFSVEYGGVVEKGGWWKPTTCKPRTKVAVIIPYRKRFEQLKIFLRHMHPFLQRQQLHYRIIVVEMLEDDPFNRAGLFNIGFVEALKLDDFDCFVFSDVDLLPEDDRNYYGCPTSPRHMSVGVDKFNYRLPYATIFGGVGSFKRQHFEAINGMSNMFWGWGGEDDDLYARITAAKFSLTRPSVQIGRYTMVRIHHFQSSKADQNRMNLLRNSRERMMVDGLNTLKYTLREVEQTPLVTFARITMKRSQYIAS